MLYDFAGDYKDTSQNNSGDYMCEIINCIVHIHICK